MNRRGFLGACLAACAAPAIVRASSIMLPRPIVIQRIEPYSIVGQLWRLQQDYNFHMAAALRLWSESLYLEALKEPIISRMIAHERAPIILIPDYYDA